VVSVDPAKLSDVLIFPVPLAASKRKCGVWPKHLGLVVPRNRPRRPTLRIHKAHEVEEIVIVAYRRGGGVPDENKLQALEAHVRHLQRVRQ